MVNSGYRITAMFLLVILVAAALNISNEGINQLCGESRRPVVAVQVQNQVLQMDWLGKDYEYSFPKFMQDLSRMLSLATGMLHRSAGKINQYMYDSDYNLMP